MSQSRVRSSFEGGAVALLGLGIFLLIPSQVEKTPGLEGQIPPSFLPMVVAIALMATGGGMVIQALLHLRETAIPKVAGEDLLRVLLSVGLLILYAFLFPRLGFVVSSTILFGVFGYLFGSRSWVKIALSMALVPAGAWLFFEVLFTIPLPRGFLF